MRNRIIAVAAALVGVVAFAAWIPRAGSADPVTTSSDMISLCSARTADPDTGVAGWAQNCVKTMTSPSASPSPTMTPLASYPNPTVTGVHGITLTADSRCTLNTANEVISNKQFTCAHEISIGATNVTIDHSWLTHGINNWTASGGHSFHLTNDTVGPASGCDSGNGSGFGVGATDFTMDNVYIRGEADAVRVSGTTSTPISITNSLLTVCTHTGDHSDGIQSDGNLAPTTVRHNTIDQRMAVKGTTTANIFWPGGGVLTADDNLLAGGGGFSLQLDASGTGTKQTVTNNKFNPAWQYGPSDSNCPEMSPWSGNVQVTIDSNYNVTGTGASVPCS